MSGRASGKNGGAHGQLHTTNRRDSTETGKPASLCLLLLVMQRDDGFHSGGAYGRDEARNGCDDDQQQRDGDVGGQVDGRDAEQLSAQEAGQDSGQCQADEESDARHAQPLRHDLGEEALGTRAERHADTDLRVRWRVV